ncbi:RNA polymerase-binding transcription factor DksA [Rahnella aquatilis]|nr:RNA polymerase-binding transcription factor DksA [Rahnella aquatilis]
MPDLMDSVQERNLEILTHQVAAHRIHSNGVSASVCEDCDQPIPAARRTAFPCVVRCVSCQEIIEQKQKHYRS